MNRIVIISFLGILLSSDSIARAIEPREQIFYLPFDGSPEAKISRGKGTPVNVGGPVRYQEGKFGQALVVGDEAAYCEYELKGNLRAAMGTLAMWIKPLNWQPSDDKFHVFFEAGAPNAGWLLLYKYYQYSKMLFRPQDETGKASCVWSEPLDWKPGEWHHLAATWMEGLMRLYIDGELVGTETKTFIPSELGQIFRLGDQPWHIPRERTQTLLDEVRIYDRPLTEKEIKGLAEIWDFQVERVPGEGKWVITVNLSNLLEPLEQPVARISISPQGTSEIIRQSEISSFPSGKGSIRIDIADLKPGKYEVRAEMRDKQSLSTKTVSVTKRDSEVLKLENHFLSLSFDAGSGALIGIENRKSGLQYKRTIKPEPVLALEAVPFDTCSRFFKPEDIKILTPDESTCQRCEIKEEDNAKKLVAEHHFQPGLAVSYEVIVRPESQLTEWKIKVDNRPPSLPSQGLIIHKVGFPILSGICIGENPEENCLALPRYQGQLVKNPSQNLPESYILHYLGSASMSWMDLYNPQGGLYFASHDRSLPQTELEVGANKEEKHLQLAIKRWTFLWPSENWSGGPCLVGIHQGDWHWGADQYRQWFLSWARPAKVPKWLKEADGWCGEGGPTYTFKDLPKILDAAEYIGLNYLQLWSEMTGGDETYHCFFYPNPFMGTVEDLKKAVAEIKGRGGHIGFYSNLVTLDATLDQFLARDKYKDKVPTEIPKPDAWRGGWIDATIMGPEGRYRHTSAGFGYSDGYWAACPNAKVWQDYIYYWVVEKWVKEYGVDAWYMDSVPPGYPGYAGCCVCFNPGHGHNRPVGMNQGVLQIFRQVSENAWKVRPFALSNEGVTDFLFQYGNIALGTELAGWSGKEPKPEIFSYTFPDFIIFSGTCNTWRYVSDYYDDMPNPTHQDALNRVFLMGFRFDILGLYPLRKDDPFTNYCRDIIALRKRIKGHLYQSDFKDDIGLGALPKNLEAKIFRHRQGKSFTLTLLDRRQERQPFQLTLNLSHYGNPKVKSATLYSFAAEQKLNPEIERDTLSLIITPFDSPVAALVIETP